MIDTDESNTCCIPGGQKNSHDVKQDKSNQGGGAESALAKHNVANTVCIGGDWFDMGCAQSPHPQDGEGPVRSVWVDPYRIAITAVSNQEFQRFIDATGYKTDAERAGSSFVFHLLLEDPIAAPASGVAPWWRDVAGACWHRPEGTGSCVKDRWDHPVVHITRDDTLQYCRWSGSRLATEAEWENAARGALVSQAYPWGDELLPHGEHRCNIWQGEFPNANNCADGFIGTAPVKEYSANSYGLYNMTGNVWEWVADRFTPMHSPRPVKNPNGPLNGERFVAKGGSYLCHESYCLRYRNSSRQALVASVSAGNLGFRVVQDLPVEQQLHNSGVTA